MFMYESNVKNTQKYLDITDWQKLLLLTSLTSEPSKYPLEMSEGVFGWQI